MIDHDQQPARLRCCAIWLTAGLGLTVLLSWLLPDLADATSTIARHELGQQPFEQLLLWLGSAAAALGATWLWGVTTLVTIQAARGCQAPTAGVPPVVRRVVLAACGVALAGGVAAPAGATPGDLHLDSVGSPAVATLDGLPLPDRPDGRIGGGITRTHLVLRLGPAPQAATKHPPQQVTLHAGDTLWGIAAAQLGPAADRAAIQVQWHRIYAANRAVIGTDPDLVHPGQHLRLPAPLAN